MQLSHSLSPHHHPYSRRIPRGNSGRSDRLHRLRREAAAHTRRISGMKERVKLQDDRRELEELRKRLIEVLLLISETPHAVRMGTHREIRSVMARARVIYADAPKFDGWRRRERKGKRPTEPKGMRAKNCKSRYDGTEEDRITLSTDTIARDPRAISFQAELDAAEAAIRAAGYGGTHDMSEDVTEEVELLVNK